MAIITVAGQMEPLPTMSSSGLPIVGSLLPITHVTGQMEPLPTMSSSGMGLAPSGIPVFPVKPLPGGGGGGGGGTTGYAM